MHLEYDENLEAFVLVMNEVSGNLADYVGQTLGVDEEARAQRMIEQEDWEWEKR